MDAMSENESDGSARLAEFRRVAIVLGVPPALLAAALLVAAFALLYVAVDWGSWFWGSGTTFSSGPTVVQLERLEYLVTTKVQVATVLTGETTWLKGSWIVRGDALIGADMSGAEIRGVDEGAKTAVVVLPMPQVMSPRVDLERTYEWDIKSRSWMPGAATVLGDPEILKKDAMKEAQKLVEESAMQPEYVEESRRRI